MILLWLVIALLEQHQTDWEVCSQYLQNFWLQNLTHLIKCPGQVRRAPPKSRIPVARDRLYWCLVWTLTLARTIKNYPFGVLELCFQCCHAPMDYDHEIAPCVQCAWRTPKTPLILGGTTSQPSALWAPWLCGSSWWCRPCIKKNKLSASVGDILSLTT